MSVLRGETCVGALALLVAGFDVSMATYTEEAQQFVDQHGPQGDLLRTLAHHAQMVREQISPANADFEFIDGCLKNIRDALCLTEDRYSQEKRKH